MADNTVELKIKLVDEATGSIKEVTAQVEGMADALKEATAQTKKMGEEAKSTTAEMLEWSMVADSLTKLSGVLDGLIEPSAAFQNSMLKANTMAGLSAEEFDAMKDKVREMSREVPLAADQLAEGLYAVISNGFDASEQLDVLRASARSALGGCADLGKVIGVSATIMKNYGLTGAEVAEIQDKIQLTAQYGVTSFEEMAGALPAVAANAATLGVSIDDLLASYATLTGVSGNTAAVSTQLAAIFTALSKPSAEAATLAAEMGVQFDAAAIKAAGGFQSFVNGLSADIDAYAEKTGMLRETVIATLFGSAEAIKAFTPLTGALSDTFAANIGHMEEAAGTMDFAFEQMSETSEARAQSWKNLFGTVTDVIQEYAGLGIEALSGIVGAMANVSSAMPAMKMIGQLYGAAALKVRAWGASLMQTAAMQKVVTVATKAWAVAQKALNFVLNMNPIGFIVLGIAALVAAIYGVIQGFKRFGDEFLLVFGPIGSAILAFKTHWDSIREAFTDGGIVAGLKRIGQVLLDVVLRPVQKLLGWVGELTGADWAKKAAEWVQEVRIKNDLAEPEGVDAVAGRREKAPEGASDATASTAKKATTTGVGAAAAKVASSASSSGQIKRIDITIDKVVETFNVTTQNLKQGAADVRDMVAKALVDAVNDVNYAL